MTELSKASCLAAAKRFTSLGLDYALVPVLSSSHSSAIWQSRVETDSLADLSNVCVRPRKDATGVFTAFGIRVAPDPYAPMPLEDLTAYPFLHDLDTMRFEAGDAEVVFAFSCDPFFIVNEGVQYSDRIYAGPLAGAQLVNRSGWIGDGVSFDRNGRTVRVTAKGDHLANVRAFPELIDALKSTGRVQVRADMRVGPEPGPPLL